MKTLYAACLTRLGLTLPMATELHGKDLDTVERWYNGVTPVPVETWDDLRQLSADIDDGADEMLEAWERFPGPVDINTSGAGHLPLMTGAAFVLSLPPGTPVAEGEANTTRAARKTRKWTGD